MRLNLLTAVAVGALALSAIPVAAAPLSPSGGQREATISPDGNAGVVLNGQSQNLVFPSDYNAAPYAGSYGESAPNSAAAPLSTSGSDR
jgi:hypothetical protein